MKLGKLISRRNEKGVLDRTSESSSMMKNFHSRATAKDRGGGSGGTRKKLAGKVPQGTVSGKYLRTASEGRLPSPWVSTMFLSPLTH